MSQILDYGSLKTALADWLNRTDLEAQLDQFIGLAERVLYRTLRCPANEVQFDYTFTNGPVSEVVLPERYLAAKTFTYNNYSLTRISMQDYQERIAAGGTRSGIPQYFVRDTNKLRIWPAPASGTTAQLTFYGDFSGLGTPADKNAPPVDNDLDTNVILQVAPDCYLFGSLIMAAAYLGTRPEDQQLWRSMYQSAYLELSNFGRDEALSGSLIVPTNFSETGGWPR